MKNFKVKCVESNKDYLTKGKVYKITNNKITFNDGSRWPFESVDEWNRVQWMLVYPVAQFELVPEPQQFTKADLKTGMWIKLRNGEKSMVLLDTPNGDIHSGETWGTMDSYKDDLTYKSGNPNATQVYDIVTVFRPTCNRGYYHFSEDTSGIVWQRHEPNKYTISEAAAKLFEIDGEPVEIVRE